MKKRIMLGVGISALVLMTLCAIVYFISRAPKPAEVELGLNLPLPDNPIVFRVEDGSRTTLGFIDPDGSNFTTREIDISLTRDRSFQVAEQTTWGSDGTFLVTGLANDWLNAGEVIPVVITDNGETRFCKDFRLFGSLWGIDSTHLLTTNDHAGGAPEHPQIVTLNMETCQIEDVLYTSSNGIGFFSMSSDGWIAHEKRDDIGIVVLDNQGRLVFEIDDALLPNWSRDGEWLAYDSYNQGTQDGIKIVNRSGSDTQVITDVGSHPWWSPDGKWLVYYTGANEIYKINIITNEKVLLYSGGRYPTWR